MRPILLSIVGALAVSAVVATAGLSCSAGANNNMFGAGGGGGSGTGTNTTTTGTGAGGGLGGGFITTTGSGGGGPSGGCSPDLQKVVDGNGNVVQTCPPDQGCYGGACIPACQAAAQSKGTIGCDFYAPDSPFYGNTIGGGAIQSGPCYAVFLANAWTKPAKVSVTRGGQAFDVTQFGRIPSGIQPNVNYAPVPATGIPPGQVAVLFLSHDPNSQNLTPLTCPVEPALAQDCAVQGSGKGQAFHLVSDTPVSAYDLLPYGGASSFLPSGSLLFPSTAWGTNYVAIDAHPPASPEGTLWSLIVASEDNTTVQIAPAQTLPGGGGIAPANQGQATQFTFNKGEMLQWVGGDPTSAVLQSDKPIGLFTGNTYLRVTSPTNAAGGGQDSAHQEIPHVNALGHEYVAAPYATRQPSLQDETIPYRMMGVVDGTVLTYDPPVPGAPLTLGAGQFLEFETSLAFDVKSQDDKHPFVVTQYMVGTWEGTRDGCSQQQFGGCGLGDEEWVTQVPSQQFLQHYIFFTDPTYPTTTLTVVRAKGKTGFKDVNIKCLGNVQGWKPVGVSGQYEWSAFDLTRGGVGVGQCATSQHEATSDGAFGVMVWGTDWYSSYAYPAGGNVGTINDVIVPPTPK